MLKLKTLRFALLITALAMAVNMALSFETFAKQRRGRFNDKKAEKFINGHDARDGRWDGRGPRFRFGDRRDHDGGVRFGDRRGPHERVQIKGKRGPARKGEPDGGASPRVTAKSPTGAGMYACRVAEDV